MAACLIDKLVMGVRMVIGGVVDIVVEALRNVGHLVGERARCRVNL